MSFHAPSTCPTKRVDGVFYFYGDTSDASWAGTVDYPDLMTETEIARYIEVGRPDLVEQLQGLRFRSSDIPLSYYGERILRRIADARVRSSFASREYEMHPNVSAFQIGGSSIFGSYISGYIARLRLKDYVQDKIINGCVLTLTIGMSARALLACASLGCRKSSFTDLENHFVTVIHLSHPEDLHNPNTTSFLQSYCLRCLEDAFDDKPLQCQESLTMQPSRAEKLKGVDRESILSAAQRLHSVIELNGNKSFPQPSSLSTASDPLNHSPNSAPTIKPRCRKQTDINTALKEVRSYTKAMQNTKDIEPSTNLNTASLPTKRMPCHGSILNRCKGQCLGQHDRTNLAGAQSHSKLCRNISSAITRSDIHHHHCTRDDCKSDSNKCSSEYCPFGRFQLCYPDCDYRPIHQERCYGVCFSNSYKPFGLHKPVYRVDTAIGRESMDDMSLKEAVMDQGTAPMAVSGELGTTMSTSGFTDEEQGKISEISLPSNNEDMNIIVQNTELVASEGGKFLILSRGIPINGPPQSTPRFMSPMTAETEVARDLINEAAPELMYDDSYSIFTSNEGLGQDRTKLLTCQFYDLAPFINAEGLSSQKLELIEAWKNTQPPSRLLARMKSYNIFDTSEAVSTEMGRVEKETLSIKLSEVLGDRN